MKIVVDGMGGDNAPQAIVQGAVMAVNEYGIDIVVTGDRDAIQHELDKYSYDKNKIEIVHTTEVITGDEKPVKAIRSKKDSSMVVALNMVKEKKADAIVSAGSTGALLSGGIFIMKRIKGISRPCICTSVPTIDGNTVLLSDTGANVDCDVENLRDFAVMTDIYARRVLGMENPKLALANIGTEEGKGNELVKKAYEVLKDEKNINFVGNMETRELLNGVCDIVIADGFVGNMVLKTMEGSVLSMLKLIKRAMMANTKTKIGAIMLKSEMMKIKDLLDYSSVGGAPFLGVEGGLVKAHGSSDEIAIKNAIRQAITLCRGNVVEEIKKYVDEQENMPAGEN